MKTNLPTRNSLTNSLVIIITASQCFFGCRDKKPQTDLLAQSSTTTVVTEVDSVRGTNTYFVQVAAFSQAENAEKVQSVLNARTYSCTIQKTTVAGGAPLWKVLVGPYNGEAEARAALRTLKKRGYQNAFVRLQPRRTGEADSLLEDAATVGPVVIKPPDEELIGKQLTESGGCSAPRWSPTGREIAFLKHLSNQEGIFTIGTGGGPQSKIVESRTGFQISDELAWAPNGHVVAFVANVVNDEFERVQNLYVIDKISRTPTVLVEQQRNDFSIHALRWSPAGGRLAFEAIYSEVGMQPFRSVFIVNAVTVNGGNDEIELIETSGSDEVSRVVGWLSEDEILLLNSPLDDVDSPALHEFRRYNLTSRQLSCVYPGFRVPCCSDIQFVVKTRDVICTETDNSSAGKYSRVVAYNLTAGTTQVLVETQSDDDRFSPVRTTGSQIFFIYDEQLWISTASERVGIIRLGVNPNDFSVSPSGGRICFEDGGNLFLLKLEI